MDDNHDGEVSYDEFVRAAKKEHVIMDVSWMFTCERIRMSYLNLHIDIGDNKVEDTRGAKVLKHTSATLSVSPMTIRSAVA